MVLPTVEQEAYTYERIYNLLCVTCDTPIS
jgi:hypothetical protein